MLLTIYNHIIQIILPFDNTLRLLHTPVPETNQRTCEVKSSGIYHITITPISTLRKKRRTGGHKKTKELENECKPKSLAYTAAPFAA